MIQILTAANAHECRELPDEPVQVVITVYCQECRSPLRPDDTCPKCDGPPPLDYSPMWKV